jgi:hypothetical protein
VAMAWYQYKHPKGVGLPDRISGKELVSVCSTGLSFCISKYLRVQGLYQRSIGFFVRRQMAYKNPWVDRAYQSVKVESITFAERSWFHVDLS